MMCYYEAKEDYIMYHGFDMSFYQSDEQYFRYANVADFIIHRSSEGVTGGDSKLMARLKASPKSLPFGIYHVIRPQSNRWEDEFEAFCKRIDECRAVREVGIALDLECSANYVPYNAGENVKIWIANMISALHQRYERPVIVYMGDLYPDGWYEAFRQAGAVFWIARWECSQSFIKHDATIWQYTSKYEGGSQDADKFLKDEAMLREIFCMDGSDIPVNPYDKDRVTDEELDHAIEVMALATLDGLFSSGAARKEAYYAAIQGRVNQLVKEGR